MYSGPRSKRRAAGQAVYAEQSMEVEPPPAPVRQVQKPVKQAFVVPKPLSSAPGNPPSKNLIVDPAPTPVLQGWQPPASTPHDYKKVLADAKLAEIYVQKPGSMQATPGNIAALLPRTSVANASVFSHMLQQTTVIAAEKAQLAGIALDANGQPVLKGRRSRGNLYQGRGPRPRGQKREEAKGINRAQVEADWKRALQSQVLSISDKIRGTLRAFTDYRRKFIGFKSYLEESQLDMDDWAARREMLKEASDSTVEQLFDQMAKDGDEMKLELQEILAKCDLSITVLESEVIEDLKVLLEGERKANGEFWTRVEIDAITEENAEEPRTRLRRKVGYSGSEMGEQRTSGEKPSPRDDESMDVSEEDVPKRYMDKPGIMASHRPSDNIRVEASVDSDAGSGELLVSSENDFSGSDFE
jgi:hypothetical protein